MNKNDTVASYIGDEGEVILYVQPAFGMTGIVEPDLVPRLYIPENGSYQTDGLWHDTPQPLEAWNSLPALLTASTGYWLAETQGPALTADRSGSYTPSRYRSIKLIPPNIQHLIIAVQPGKEAFTNAGLMAYEKEFWEKHSPISWKWIRSYLPKDLPDWEIGEAKKIWLNGSRAYGYIPAVSLAAARKQFFNNRRWYYQALGQEETAEEAQERKEYNRDARLMSGFYRIVSNLRGRESLIRRTKVPAAKRLAGRHATGLRQATEQGDLMYIKANMEIDTWIADSSNP